MSVLIIRRIELSHCKRGPDSCSLCREMRTNRTCLLDIDPPQPGQIQRRVIEVLREGRTVWCEFDVVRVFETQDEALSYAAEHGIDDLDLG